MRKNLFSGLLILAFSVFVNSSLVYALNTSDTGYKVNPGTTAQVTCAGVCHKVTNNSTKAIFVPTKTQNEWNQFAAHLPSGVTVAACVAACEEYTDCAYTWCYNGDIWCYSNCDVRKYISQACNYYEQLISGGSCVCNYNYCTTGGLLPDTISCVMYKRVYDGSCTYTSPPKCKYTDTYLGLQQYKSCTSAQHAYMTAAGCTCASGAPSC